MNISRMIPCLVSALLMATPAHALTRTISLSNGTGFFISKDGYIVTNAHVVRQCKSLVRATGSITTDADIIARDDKNDLALLKSRLYAPAFARLRYDNNVAAKEAAIVLGYPGQAGAQGTISFVKSSVIAEGGPKGEPQWLQFANAAQKGNSGGPLLDASGNVIGVITGKTQLYRVARSGNAAPEIISESDVAVNLTTLKHFLNRNRARFATSTSNLLFFSDNRLQDDARDFIVQLKCTTGETVTR